MLADLFVDTNISVYAHDLDAGEKHARARGLVDALWLAEPLPWISVQVLQELAASLRRREVPVSEIRDLVADYSRWRVVANTVDTLRAAVAEMSRWQISLWDALILAAARTAKVPSIWSEDLGDGQDYGGVRVVNPLVKG